MNDIAQIEHRIYRINNSKIMNNEELWINNIKYVNKKLLTEINQNSTKNDEWWT